MDYRRLMLALAAQSLQELEARRSLWLSDRLEDLTPEEWARLAAVEARLTDE